MKKQFLFAALAVATLFTACSKEEELSQNNGSTPVNFVIGGVGSRTATTLADGSYSTVFEANDAIGIYASGGATVANSKFAVVDNSGSQSLSGTAISYEQGVSTTFKAYYPYNASAAETVTMTVGDQTSGIDAYDLLTATATTSTETIIRLSFEHQLAMVQVQVSGEIGETATSMTLKNVLPTVTWTAATNTLSEATGTATDIPMYCIDETDNIYVALVPAQTISSNTAMFSTTIGTKTYTFKPNSEVTLTTNTVSKFAITIDKTYVNMEANSVNFNVAGWEVSESVIEDFEMTEEEVPAIELISATAGTISESTVLNTATSLADINAEGWWSLLIGTNSSTIAKSSDNSSFELNIATESWNNRCLVYRIAADKIENSTTKKFKMSLNAKMTSGTQIRISARQVSNPNFFNIGVDSSISKNLAVSTDYATENMSFEIDFNKYTTSTSNITSESWSATETSQLDDVIIMITSNATNTTVNVKDITLIEVQE